MDARSREKPAPAGNRGSRRHLGTGSESPLDTAEIDAGQDIGNVVVQRRAAHGFEDIVYDVGFAFAFHAFHLKAPTHAE
jgi:hypothetical protein